MIRIAVVEDNQMHRETAVQLLRKYEAEHHVSMEIREFADGREIIEGYRPCWDLILLDIEMPGLNGMEAARLIRSKDEGVILVFITNIAQYAIKGYEVGALDFILKPLRYSAFEMKLGHIVSQIERKKGKSVVITAGDRLRKVAVADILYVEVINHQVIYHLQGGETIEFRGSLKAEEDLLAGQDFARCNSGYLVNLQYVTGIRDGMAVVGRDSLPISRARKKEFIKAVADYISGI